MALFSECIQKCARKPLDTADIVRDAMFRQEHESREITRGHLDVGLVRGFRVVLKER